MEKQNRPSITTAYKSSYDPIPVTKATSPLDLEYVRAGFSVSVFIVMM